MGSRSTARKPAAAPRATRGGRSQGTPRQRTSSPRPSGASRPSAVRPSGTGAAIVKDRGLGFDEDMERDTSRATSQPPDRGNGGAPAEEEEASAREDMADEDDEDQERA
jgi:hypothetical protein